MYLLLAWVSERGLSIIANSLSKYLDSLLYHSPFPLFVEICFCLDKRSMFLWFNQNTPVDYM